MADKKKNTSQSQMVSPKARSSVKKKSPGPGQGQIVAPVAASDEKEQSKNVKAAARERDERKVQESKTVRRENKGASAKGPATWQVRMRSNRYVRFVLDAYYELRHKVTWPTFNEARNMTIVVILLSAALAAILGTADQGLNQLYLLITSLGGK